MHDPGRDERLSAPLRRLGFASQAHGDTLAIVPPLCAIPAGPFLMGSDPQRDPEAWPLEFPQHTVVTAAYAIARYPVTVAEYACAVAAGAVPAPEGWGGSRAWTLWPEQLRSPTRPVLDVRWAEALTYAAWLAQVTGEHWRLPTEAEWEKAARGPDGRIYPWGDQFDPANANTDEAQIGQTTPVDTYAHAASPYGVVDLIGNVYEWCSTLWRPYPYDPADGREDLSVPDDWRIRRGGDFEDYKNNARAATRWPSKSRPRAPTGIRLVREPLA